MELLTYTLYCHLRHTNSVELPRRTTRHINAIKIVRLTVTLLPMKGCLISGLLLSLRQISSMVTLRIVDTTNAQSVISVGIDRHTNSGIRTLIVSEVVSRTGV